MHFPNFRRRNLIFAVEALICVHKNKNKLCF